MDTAEQYLKNVYAIRGGKIDPWGTFRVLGRAVREPKEDDPRLQPGLVIWNEKLVQYGEGNYHVSVLRDVVIVIAGGAAIVAEISHSDFVVVQVKESYVHKNGYLQYSLVREDSPWTRVIDALDQAAKGEMPCCLDNSSFTQIDQKFAGQEVIEITYGNLGEAKAAVYTKDGERIPSKLHYPLSYAKWAPDSPGAEHSVVEKI